jgi:arylsulfatase A-like enzyme
VALACVEKRLHGLPSACNVPPSPACAGAALDDTLTLLAADQPLPSAPLIKQRRCQRAMTRAARRFVARRLLERADGLRGQRSSARSFGAVARKCGVSVADDGAVALPALHGPCDGAFGAPGTTPDPAIVTHCLRPALEHIVDDVVAERMRPNIVVVLTDDQRWDTLYVMPRTTDLARHAVAFTNAFVTTSLCCPSRASLYSGKYAHHHGVLDNGGPHGGAPAFPDQSTLPVWLSQVDYSTALFGKYMNENQLIVPRVPPGWGEWQTFVENGGTPGNDLVYYDYTLNENGVLRQYGRTPEEYSTDLLRDRSLAYIDAHANAPFFLVYAPFGPHEPATPAPRHAGYFAGLAPWRPPNWCEADVSDKPVWVRFMAAIVTPAGLAATDALRVRQLESLLAIDEAVGAILERLEHLGLTDQTLVVFTSDNGFMWHEHWWASKIAPYEESIRVPLVLRYPVALPLPAQSDALALNIDLAPTFVEAAGTSAPPGIDGRSLLAALRGEPWREDFLIEHNGGPIVSPDAGVRTPHVKLIETLPDGFLELYDLDADPYELESRAGDPAWAEVQAALMARLAALRAE